MMPCDEDVREAVLGDEHRKAGGGADDGLFECPRSCLRSVAQADGRRRTGENSSRCSSGLRRREPPVWRGWV